MLSEITVIKDESQYRNYLSEIEQLVVLDPEVSSPEGKRLELLALLVESYEKERYKIPLPNPVDAILFRLEQQGLQQKDLVPLIGSKGRVSEVLSGKRRLTVPMVRNLSVHLGIPAAVLVGEPQPEGKQLDIDPPLPLVREIVKRGWVSGGRVTPKNAKEFVARLFEMVGTREIGPAYLRSSIRAGITGHVNLYAIRLWIARVLIKSREHTQGKAKFQRDAFGDEEMRQLVRLSTFETGPALAHEYLLKHGIILVVEPHLSGTRLDGAAVLDADGTPVIGMTLRHNRLDNFWYTLLHECAHIVKHLTKPNEMFVDDIEGGHDTDVQEIEANRIARDLLIPQEDWRHSDANRLKTTEAIVALAEKLKIHTAIVAGRIRRETGNYKLFSSLVGYGEPKRVLNIS